MRDFKKHNWMSYGYNRQGNIIEITVKDESGRKLDYFKSNNHKNTKEIAKILRNKYGLDLNPEIKESESINALNEERSLLDINSSW